jgi:hypothetical protein
MDFKIQKIDTQTNAGYQSNSRKEEERTFERYFLQAKKALIEKKKKAKDDINQSFKAQSK